MERQRHRYVPTSSSLWLPADGEPLALKHGHATRPLPVVRKKTLSGVGKDRDGAVPFWDQSVLHCITVATLITARSIFASTAANILSPSLTPAPRPPAVVAVPLAAPRLILSPSARMGREVARRGLYSRFFKGTSASLSADATPEAEEDSAMVGIAGPSSIKGDGMHGREGLAKEGETKEQRRVRKMERATRRALKEETMGTPNVFEGDGKRVRGTDDVEGNAVKRKRRKHEEQAQGSPDLGGTGDDAEGLAEPGRGRDEEQEATERRAK